MSNNRPTAVGAVYRNSEHSLYSMCAAVLTQRVRTFATIDVAPGVAVSIVIGGGPQIGTNVSTVNL